MPSVYYFDINRDQFYEAVLLYAAKPYDMDTRKNLLHITNMLTVESFLNQAENTRETCSLYLMKIFLYAGILEEHIEPLAHLLRHSQSLGSRQHQCLLTQLFAPDAFGMSAYDMARQSRIPELVSLVLNICEDLVKRNILMVKQKPEVYANYLLDTHLRLLACEYLAYKIDEATYHSEHAQLLVKPQQLEHLFMRSNANGYRMLSKLVKPGRSPCEFKRVLHILKDAYQQGWVSLEVYKSCLLVHRRSSYTLLHQLVFRGEKVADARLDATNFKAYLDAVDALRETHLLSHDGYLRLFTQENKHGYSVVHQAVNAPNLMVARAFIKWFDSNPYLSVKDKEKLLNYKSSQSDAEDGAKRAPCRRNKLGMREVHSWLRERRDELREIPQISRRGWNSFYPLQAEIPEYQVDPSTWVPSSLNT